MKIALFLISLILFPIFSFAQDGEKEYKEALEYSKNKKYKKALKSIDKAIAYDEKEVYIIEKTSLLIATGSTRKEVIKYLNSIIDLDNPSPILLQRRGYEFLNIYEYQDAILDYTDALKYAKNDSLKASY